MSITRINVRVYGILLHKGRVLVSDEVFQGVCVTKFPGGGLQPGEGTLECLRREVKEEMAAEVLRPRHYYTTDFFQQSAHRPEDQIISIYYTFEIADPDSVATGVPAPGKDRAPGQQLRWLHLDRAQVADMDLPIDRVVLRALLLEHANDQEPRPDRS